MALFAVEISGVVLKAKVTQKEGEKKEKKK